ncbi:MAG: DNA polymerase III subunit delta [Clostridia bacterium]|nr:DNA polymerase III subunit delta [Clostridia bacterium]
MALSEKSLKQSLDNGAILPVYVIVGNDSFLKTQAKDRIIKAAIGEDDGFNLVTFENDCNLEILYNELSSCSFTSDKKCVVLSDYDVDKCSKNEFDSLLELAGTKYETSVFILYFDAIVYDPKKSGKIKELMKAAEGVGGSSVIIDHRTKEELARQLVASAKKRNCLLSTTNAGYLIDVSSTDINTLLNEIEKLCLYIKQGEITKEIIDSVAVKSVEASIFDLSKKIIAGDTAGALKLLDDLYYMRVSPDLIIHQIGQAFVDLYRASAAKKQGVAPESAAGDFNMKNTAFRLKNASYQLGKYDDNKINLSFDALINAEREKKSYSTDARVIIERLIVRLIYIMKTGEALD